MDQKRCKSCYVLHLPTKCPGEKPAAASRKKCDSCFISHTPDKCPKK